MEYPARVHRADVQSPVRERAGAAHRDQRPEDPRHLRRSGGARRRSIQPLEKNAGPQVGACSRRRPGCGRPSRSRRPGETSACCSTKPARRPRRAAAYEKLVADAAARRLVAVVPRRAAATTTSRSTSPPDSAGLRHLGVKRRRRTPAITLARADSTTGATACTARSCSTGTGTTNHLSPTIALYLYGRSFFLKDEPFAPRTRRRVDYWLAQARQYWLQTGQPPVAGAPRARPAAVRRPGRRATTSCTRSRSTSVHNEEMGMFWRDTEHSWWWYRAPIETQAMMIEAFDEVMQRLGRGRGLQGLAAQAEADAGLEDDQGHGRRGLRPAASRPRLARLRRARRGLARRPVDQARSRWRPARASTSSSFAGARDHARDGPRHGEEDRPGRRAGAACTGSTWRT